MVHLGPRQSVNTETSADAATATQVASTPTSDLQPTSTTSVDTATGSSSPQATLTSAVTPTTDSTLTSPSSAPSTTTSAEQTTTTSPTSSAPESTTTSPQPQSSAPSTSESPSSTPSPTSTSSSSSSDAQTTTTSSSAPLTSPISSASTSLQGTPTTIVTSFTVLVNGSPVISQALIPTTISQPPHSSSSSTNRTAIIAGSAAGAAVLIILAVSIIFYSRRKHFKRLSFIDAITSRRKEAHSRAMLLAGEDMEDEVELWGTGPSPPPLNGSGRYVGYGYGYAHVDGNERGYGYGTPWDAGASGSLSYGGTTPSRVGHAGGGPTVPARLPSESGSVFREDVWPPPNESSTLMSDPLAQAVSIDLSSIVDDVMGPSSTAAGAGEEAAHFSERSMDSSYRERESERERRGGLHSRDASTGSEVSLLQASGSAGAAGSGGNQPTRSSPLVQRADVRDTNAT